MTIDEVIKEAERLTFEQYEQYEQIGQEDRCVITLFNYEDKGDQEIVEAFKEDLEKLIIDIETDQQKIEAAAKILQLLFKYIDRNDFNNSFHAHGHRIKNFNKPERTYQSNIKAAETIIESMHERLPSGDKQGQLTELLNEYIQQQKHLINDLKRGAHNLRDDHFEDQIFHTKISVKVGTFTKREFEKRLKIVLDEYGVKKHLRPIIDNLTNTGYAL